MSFNGPLRKNPINPRYFTDDSGQAIYLTGSHTWATQQDLWLDNEPRHNMDYDGFLQMMADNNHNFLRFWQFYPNAPEGETTTRRVYRLLGLGSYGVLFPLFVLGLWLGRHEFRRLAVLYGFLCYFTLVHCLVYGKLRYRIPMDGVILAFSASGALWVAERLVTGRLHVFERWLAGKPAAQKGN